MRNLFLALVLANLAFAAWHFWYSGADAPPGSTRPDGPAITLLSEAPPTPRPAVPAAPAPSGAELTPAEFETGGEPAAAPALAARVDGVTAPVTAAAPGCVSVGPFRELSQAANAAASLRSAGYAPTQRVADGEIWVGYWVYLERIPTGDEAEAILADLRENGVTDSYVIPDSDGNNLVSLGVFSEISRAGRRREEVRTLGYEPVVTDRTRRGTVYWVDVLLAAGQSLDFDALQTPGRILRLEQRACPE